MGVFERLTQRCRRLVEGVDRGLLEDSGGQPPLQQMVNLHHSLEGVILVELFAGLSTGLAAVLEAGLLVHIYVYVDNNDTMSKAAKHHIKQLQARYLRQLPISAVQSGQPGRHATVGLAYLGELSRVSCILRPWTRIGLGYHYTEARGATSK